MPQLMPLSWNFYFVMVMMLIVAGGILYWMISLNEMIKENEVLLIKNSSNYWMWCLYSYN